MTIRTTPWPAGVPCWADLSTPDVTAAKGFYSAVIGWEFQDTEDEYGGYAIATSGGHPAAGVGPAQPDAPVAWTMYFASDDADKAAAAVAEAGGTVIVAPGDVGPLGRMFIAADPTGAAFGVWQAGTHIGAGITNQPGGLAWEDLRTTDPDAARAFYEAVFGFTFQALDGAGEDYTMFHLPGDDAPLGGMGGMMGAEGASPHWLTYFSVASTDAALAAAEGAGGTVVAPAFDTPYGRMAGITDPAGALFWVVENTTDQPQPER